ncbi:MAG: hypothetical protein ACWGOX_00805 [Desulforhopalus sp.]
MVEKSSPLKEDDIALFSRTPRALYALPARAAADAGDDLIGCAACVKEFGDTPNRAIITKCSTYRIFYYDGDIKSINTQEIKHKSG